MTKHTDEFLQCAAPVTCGEYTIPRDDKSTDPKGWIQGNTKKVTTSYLQGKHVVEIRIEYVNNGNSHSWVRISHGLNKLVTNLIDKEYDDNEQETSTTKTEVFAFANRPKAKANREDFPLLAHLQGLFLFHGLILNQELNSVKLTQWQKEKTLFFDTEKYLEKKMMRSNSGD